MVVYLDILLIENFLINLFLMNITLQTIKKKVAIVRSIISSMIGSLYILTMIIPQLKIFTATPFKIVMAFIMVLLALGHKDITALFKGTIIFILYSMVLAGITFYLAIKDNPNIEVGATIYNFSSKNIILALMILYLIINRIVIYVKDRKEIGNYIYNIEIGIGEKKTMVKTFLDTGNELREPVTNLPVIIVEKEIFKDINVKNHNVFHIPYSVVSGYGGSLIGIKPDCIKINFNGTMREEKAILAFSERKLSKHNDYNGLLPRGIIE